MGQGPHTDIGMVVERGGHVNCNQGECEGGKQGEL